MPAPKAGPAEAFLHSDISIEFLTPEPTDVPSAKTKGPRSIEILVQCLHRYVEAHPDRFQPRSNAVVRIAFYGRYGCDNQRDTSIEDQRRIVVRWAEPRGHTIVTEFTDYATSAASLKVLDGLRQALRAATATPAPFDALVLDQLSRLSRDVGDTDPLVKQLKFLDIRIIAVQDGIDTADETTKISATVKSLVNEIFLDNLRKTTKRGLDGQFLKGFSTGGRTYGFRSEPAYDATGRADAHGHPVPIGYRLFIDEAEAAILREIFRRFAGGDV